METENCVEYHNVYLPADFRRFARPAEAQLSETVSFLMTLLLDHLLKASKVA